MGEDDVKGQPASANSSEGAADTHCSDDLEPQLKYERLGADVKTILQTASATFLCLSEKVLALGTSAGNIHVLDYSGNEVKRFSLHSRAVTYISFDDKAEYIASCSGLNHVSISSLYSDETNKYTFKRPITVVALEPRYASRKTREFITGDVRGRLKISSQGWLGRSDTVVHQGEGVIRAVAWHSSTLIWANDVGIKVYDTNTHQFIGSISRPRGGRFADCYDCRLYLHEGAELYAAWPDCIKVAKIVTSMDPVSAAVQKRLHVTLTVPTDYFCMSAVPHGNDLAVLVYVTDQDPDQDPDQDQVYLLTNQAALPGAPANTGEQHLQQQQQEADLEAGEQQQQQEAQQGGAVGTEVAGTSTAAVDAPSAAASSDVVVIGSSSPGIDKGQQNKDGSPAKTGPFNMPQPAKRPPRAASAMIRSPSVPSMLEAAAASAVAGAAAAATAAGDVTTDPSLHNVQVDNSGSSSVPSSSPNKSAAASAPASPAASRRVSPGVSFANRAVAAGAHANSSSTGAAAALSSPGAAGKPPLSGGYSRSGSAASRVSGTSDVANATEYVPEAYAPAGNPLRPELRILSVPHSSKAALSSSNPSSSDSCVEKASDALTVKGYSEYLPADYHLVPSFGNEFALLSVEGTKRQQRTGTGRKPAAAAAAAAHRQTANGSSSTSDTLSAVPDSSAAAAAAAAAAATTADETANSVESGSKRGVELPIEDYGEFMYFIVSPKDIVVGRHRDLEDRISWCLQAGRFEAALTLAEADRSLPRTVLDTVAQAYLEYLTRDGKWGVAAAVLPRLLRDQTPLWEKWVYAFAQAQRLPLIGPVLPTRQPTLHSQCYNVVLQALLADNTQHGQLLSLVQSWPSSCFHPTALIDAIAQRLQKPGGDSRELWQTLAVLYKSQGRPDLSLAVYLQLQLPSVFDFIQEHSLLSYLDQKAYLLMAVDEDRALELLAGHLDTLPPGAVIPGLLDAMSVAESDGDEEGRELWRHRLFNYLDRVFQVDAGSGGEYAELCVHLYADYAPARLMEFLQGSQTYPLEAALEVAEQRGMVDEQVYILSRMGNSRAALALIIERQQDIPQAIEFVRLQREEELWEELIDWALRSADTTGQLLEHIGGNINPLRVIQKIPEGMEIQQLRDRLRGIIADFRTQTSLREGCNAILRSDCLRLVQRLHGEVKQALPVVWVQRVAGSISAAAVVDVNAGQAGTAADTTANTAALPGAVAIDLLSTGFTESPVRLTAAKVKTTASNSSSFLPAASAAGASKGPLWLKYQCATGHPMTLTSAQDVPTAALAAAGASPSAPAAQQTPVAVWIGYPHNTPDALAAAGEGGTAPSSWQSPQQQQQQQQVSPAGASSSSRRSNRTQRHQRFDEQLLPSLLTA